MAESLLDTDTVHIDRNLHSKWSLKQAELFVGQQGRLLESNELRALPPAELQSKVQDITNDNPLHAPSYFLSYMNQLRLRDYFGATEELHRAFDRSPMQVTQQSTQKGFQYLSMQLAVLHASFGHRREALTALKECVMLAQECGDKRCLELANSWYCLLNSHKIDPFEKSLPDIQDPELVQSLSLAIKYVVKFGAQCGYLPLDLFELLQKSDELNCKDSIIEQMTDSLALRSALWCLYGRHEVSALYAQMLLNLKKTWAFGDVGNSESVCKVLSSLSLWLNIQGEQQISAVLSNHSRERFPRFPYSSIWHVSQCHVVVQQSIYRQQWGVALRACCQLFQIDRNAGNLQRARVFIARRNLCRGRQILEKMIEQEDLDPLTKVRAYVQLTLASISQPYYITAQTIDYLMKASVLAASAYMEYEYACVDMILAQILLFMRMPQKAFQAATNAMVTIYVNGGVYDRAIMDFTFVRCCVGAANEPAEKMTCLRRCLHILERAQSAFKSLEAHSKVLDVYIYAAVTYHQLETMSERNKWASRFQHYYNEHPVTPEFLNVIY